MSGPNFAVILVLAASAAWSQPSEQEIRKGLAANPQNAELHAQYGLFLSSEGRLREAIPEFEAALRINPKLTDTAYNLGLALLQEGRADEAMNVLDRHPGSSADHLALRGAVLNALGRAPEAAAALRRAVALDPKNADTVYDLALTLLRIDASAEASQLLQRGRVRFPKVAKIHAVAGMVAYLNGKNEEAMRAYEIAVKLEPDAADMQAALGDVYDATGELNKAEAAYEKAVRLEAGNAAYRVKYGRNLAKLQKADAAADMLRQAVKLEAGNADGHFELGKLAAARSEDASAAAHFEKAVAANPSLKQGWYQLALSYRRLGQQDKSNSAMEQFRKLP
ncbi:MAG: tetratricopeptide repeat protein [Bryobacterales bacterium]|nr:tetratricopeptide repeat protein [Bryobacterales bacterium]